MKKQILLSILLICTFPALHPELRAAESDIKSDAQPQNLKDKALTEYLIGTWAEDTDSDGVKAHAESTYKADGTFSGTITFDAPGAPPNAPKSATFSGKWKIEGDISIETLEKISLEGVPVPIVKKFKIQDIRNNTHTSKDMEDGTSSLNTRKT